MNPSQSHSPESPTDRNTKTLRHTLPSGWFSQSFWLALSLTVAVLCGILGLKAAFRFDYLVDSDSRQHVYWMQRFLDPALFPNDLITDYHQSVAPIGYATVYHGFASLGISPLLLNKWMPLGLGIIATLYGFWLTLELLPIPFAGFLSTLLLNQTLWMRYDLISGTPRAFIYPILLAFLYYLSRRSLFPCLITLGLQGLFYPQMVFVSAGILLLLPWHWHQGRLHFGTRSRSRFRWRDMLTSQDVQVAIAGLLTAFGVMLPYALQSSEFGPAITVDVARTLPEFLPDGRTPFWVDNPWQFWLYGSRSSLLAQPGSVAPFAWLCLGLPWLLRSPQQFPLVKLITPQRALLSYGVMASVGMWAIAHVLLFRLHLPSRYTQHSFPVILSIAGGITLTVLLEAILRHQQSPQISRWQQWGIHGCLGLAIASFVVLPLVVPFPYHKYKQGQSPDLYTFLAQQPKDSMIASLSDEANYIPTFAQRSVLVSEMYAIPYHVGYYNQIRQRTLDLVDAHYSSDRETLRSFIQTYSIDLWVIDRNAFDPDYLQDYDWLQQFQPQTNEAIAHLEQNQIPILQRWFPLCTVFKTRDIAVVESSCLLSRMNHASVPPEAQ